MINSFNYFYAHWSLLNNTFSHSLAFFKPFFLYLVSMATKYLVLKPILGFDHLMPVELGHFKLDTIICID